MACGNEMLCVSPSLVWLKLAYDLLLGIRTCQGPAGGLRQGLARLDNKEHAKDRSQVDQIAGRTGTRGT